MLAPLKIICYYLLMAPQQILVGMLHMEVKATKAEASTDQNTKPHSPISISWLPVWLFPVLPLPVLPGHHPLFPVCLSSRHLLRCLPCRAQLPDLFHKLFSCSSLQNAWTVFSTSLKGRNLKNTFSGWSWTSDEMLFTDLLGREQNKFLCTI